MTANVVAWIVGFIFGYFVLDGLIYWIKVLHTKIVTKTAQKRKT